MIDEKICAKLQCAAERGQVPVWKNLHGLAANFVNKRLNDYSEKTMEKE